MPYTGRSILRKLLFTILLLLKNILLFTHACQFFGTFLGPIWLLQISRKVDDTPADDRESTVSITRLLIFFVILLQSKENMKSRS